jgi:ribulose-5-phosphate 4-epimerase/fuculose-1-phosphate aldolase
VTAPPHEALIAAARRTVSLRLNHGTTGNLSVRIPNGMLVTPRPFLSTS